MNSCSYNVNIVVLLMQLLMVFCSLICLSERTTHVKCSIIIMKPKQTLYTLLRYISLIYLNHVASNLRGTINETA